MRAMRSLVTAACILVAGWSGVIAGALVLQTDFGTQDGAVAAMKGVAVQVDPRLPIHDLTHEIPAYDVWLAAYRLRQTVPYWPEGTVFVSVVDPGVGTARRAVVMQTKSGHLIVSPDNGTLTLVAEDLGVAAVREIDESSNRLAGSEKSYTFHGRDVFAYTGARLAAGAITFESVGPIIGGDIVRLVHERPRREGAVLVGGIPTLDIRYGNVWTDIGEALFAELKPTVGDRFLVRIAKAGREVYAGEMPYVRSFGDVPEGESLLYLNSLLNVSFALNMRSFAAAHQVESGGAWSVRIEKIAR